MPRPRQQTIDHLNAVLKYTLTGINQYFLHARMLKHQGMLQLADYEYRISLAAMKHGDMLVEHILSLGGAPDLQNLDTLAVGKKRADILANDFRLAENAIAALGNAIAFCETQKDKATAALLQKILAGEQEHAAFVKDQINTSVKDCA